MYYKRNGNVVRESYEDDKDERIERLRMVDSRSRNVIEHYGKGKMDWTKILLWLGVVVLIILILVALWFMYKKKESRVMGYRFY